MLFLRKIKIIKEEKKGKGKNKKKHEEMRERRK